MRRSGSPRLTAIILLLGCNRINDPCERAFKPMDLDVAESLEGVNAGNQASEVEGIGILEWSLDATPISVSFDVDEPSAQAEEEVVGCEREVIISADSTAVAMAGDLLEGAFSGTVHFKAEGPEFGLNAEGITVGPSLAALLEAAGYDPAYFSSFDASLEGGLVAGDLTIFAVGEDGSGDTALTGDWATGE